MDLTFDRSVLKGQNAVETIGCFSRTLTKGGKGWFWEVENEVEMNNAASFKVIVHNVYTFFKNFMKAGCPETASSLCKLFLCFFGFNPVLFVNKRDFGHS